MSKVIDFDALWGSQKLKQVPAQFRGEWIYFIGYGKQNASFVADAETIYLRVYRENRPWVTSLTAISFEEVVSQVREMLRAFNEAKLLFLWTVGVVEHGYVIGSHLEGRHVPRSRLYLRAQKGEWPPAKALAEFLGVPVLKVQHDLWLLGEGGREAKDKEPGVDIGAALAVVGDSEPIENFSGGALLLRVILALNACDTASGNSIINRRF
jgi:hypothetical protein